MKDHIPLIYQKRVRLATGQDLTIYQLKKTEQSLAIIAKYVELNIMTLAKLAEVLNGV